MSYDDVLLVLLFLIPAAVIGILFALFARRRRAVEVAGYVIGGIGFVGLAVCFGGDVLLRYGASWELWIASSVLSGVGTGLGYGAALQKELRRSRERM